MKRAKFLMLQEEEIKRTEEFKLTDLTDLLLKNGLFNILMSSSQSQRLVNLLPIGVCTSEDHSSSSLNSHQEDI
jgi:hypothetical protein